MRWQICVSFVVAFLLHVRPSMAAEPVRTWMVGGVERQGLVFAPESARSVPTPLIFAFHGHGGSMQTAEHLFAYEKLWPEAIVIYLQGLPTPGRLTDPEGKLAGWQSDAGNQGDRDLKLFDAVLKWARENYKVDERRIYCTGYSNGGGFTYLLWAARGDTFAAVAPACGADFNAVHDLKPKPLLHIAGLKDPIVKLEWQKAMIDAARRINKCQPNGKAEGDRITVYPSDSGNTVETYLYDGGHTPPAEAWPEVIKFFKDHPGKG